jgi:phosphate transport system substrate-binding protein
MQADVVVPAPERFQAAAAGAEWGKTSDFDLLIIDAPGADAYPLVVTVFAQMQKSMSAGRARDTLNFFRWSLEKGARDASDLGYVPLQLELVGQIKDYWTKSLKVGS